MALGARGVLVGRPVLWALATGGADGVRRLLRALARDLELAMALCGASPSARFPRDLGCTVDSCPHVNDRPIGMFDSGFGGLTVARALIDLLPGEDLVYFGDTGRYPYGPRPLDEVREFALADHPAASSSDTT